MASGMQFLMKARMMTSSRRCMSETLRIIFPIRSLEWLSAPATQITRSGLKKSGAPAGDRKSCLKISPALVVTI